MSSQVGRPVFVIGKTGAAELLGARRRATVIATGVKAMARVEIGKSLATDTRICGGRVIFRGTRILAADVLELLEEGHTPEEIAADYSNAISAQAVREAASLTRRGIVREIRAKTAA